MQKLVTWFVAWGALVSIAIAAPQMNCDGYTLDRLPLVPDGNIRVLQQSSRNRTGENADMGYYLYENERGEKVIFDSLGPGCVKNMWGTCLHDDAVCHFYFGDETTPRISCNMKELFAGKCPYFQPPTTSYLESGYFRGPQLVANSFTPIPFEKRLRIAVSGELMYHHTIYELYRPGSYAPKDLVDAQGTLNPDAMPPGLLRAFEKQGTDPKADRGTEVLKIAADGTWEHTRQEGAGSIRRLTIDMPADTEFLRDVELRIRFDDEPFAQVNVPLGMLFANAYKPHAMEALPIRMEMARDGRVRGHCYFPMPYWKSFEISLVGPRDGQVVNFELALSKDVYPKSKTGYFCTTYRRGQTEYSRDWLFGQAYGRGWFLGVTQSMQYDRYWEGDERFYVDDSGSPAFNGTGSEDYHLCCYWPNLHFTLPFGGSVGNIREEAPEDALPNRIPSSYYRFHLEAPIPFHRSLRAYIEHGPDSDVVSQYRSVSFFYVAKGEGLIQTDMLDVGSPANEAAHGYHCSPESETVELAAEYEGTFDQVTRSDEGRIHRGGPIEFTVAIESENNGVKLRRRLDQKQGRHMAKVFVDGQLAGTWYFADHNEHKRWADDDFEIAPALTRDKDRLKIRIEPQPLDGDQAGVYSDFRYRVFSYVDE